MLAKEKTKWESVLDAYNEALAEAYQSVLDSVESEEALSRPGFEEQLYESVRETMQLWYDTPLDAADGQQPGALFGGLEAPEACMEVFLLAAARCDEDVPEPLTAQMATFGTDMKDRLMTRAFAAPWTAAGRDRERSDGLLQAAASLRLLGSWNAGDVLEMVLARYLSEENPDEMVSEAFTAFCAGVGAEAAPVLTEALLQAAAEDRLSGPYEYALVALTGVGQEKPADSIFLCLRTCFRRMDNKMIPAICLGDYGDGRGIPVLKGYVERHTDGMSRSLFYEILSAIQRLGGDISDIRDPFRRGFGMAEQPRQ